MQLVYRFVWRYVENKHHPFSVIAKLSTPYTFVVWSQKLTALLHLLARYVQCPKRWLF